MNRTFHTFKTKQEALSFRDKCDQIAMYPRITRYKDKFMYVVEVWLLEVS